MSGDLTARDVIAREVHLQVPALQHGPIGTEFVADAVLAALAAAGWRLERDDQWEWEWGVRFPDGEVGLGHDRRSEAWIRDYVQTALTNGHVGCHVVRRPVGRGQWEVAPDA